MTTVFMHTAGSNTTGALVELLDFGLAGPANVPIPCSISTDTIGSTFAMTFDYFGDLSLYYDPGNHSYVEVTVSYYFNS